MIMMKRSEDMLNIQDLIDYLNADLEFITKARQAIRDGLRVFYNS
jgi:hypothetical protein